MLVDTSFSPDTIYVTNQPDQKSVFSEVTEDLLKQDLVTKDFLTNLITREKNYPTGLDLLPINSKLPNIAIPHTESDFVKTTRIIPIKLQQPILFNNMINPEEQLSVDFLFMILNQNGVAQANLLANIMDFINGTEPSDLINFFQLTCQNEIYQFLKNNFKGEI